MHIIHSNAMPSIGMLTGFRSDAADYSNAAIAELHGSAGWNSYFGSDHDRYFTTFSSHIQPHLRQTFATNRILRSIGATILNPTGIRALTSAAALSSPPPEMYIPILCHPELYRLLRNKRIQGYAGYTAEALTTYAEAYQRIVLKNGIISYDLYADHTYEPQEFRTLHKDSDPKLSQREIEDIRSTWDYIDRILDVTDLDPTCLTQLRG